MDLAERHATLRAPARLLGGGLGLELVVDLGEIRAPFLGAPLIGHLAVDIDEFQHPFRHGCFGFPLDGLARATAPPVSSPIVWLA